MKVNFHFLAKSEISFEETKLIDMKKIKLTVIILFIALIGKTQVEHWTTDLIAPNGNTGNIGTSNDRSFNVFTNNYKRFTVDSLGGIKSSTLQGNGYRLLYADKDGYIGTMANRPVGGGWTPSQPCELGASAWFEGGNNVGNLNNGASNREIGTCNNKDFILKAYNKKALFITAQDAYVGIGETNTTPTAALDVFNLAAISFTANQTHTNHTLIKGDEGGTIESTTGFLALKALGNTSGGISLNTSGILTFNNSNSQILKMDQNGNSIFGTGSISGNTKLTINSAGNDGIQTRISSNSVKAFNVYNTATNKENFVVFGDGKTSIGNESGATNSAFFNVNVAGGTTASEAINIWDQHSGKINFKVKSNGQTNIGNQTNATNSAFLNLNVAGTGSGSNSENVLDVFEQSSGKVNFRVKSSGNVYCRELEVLPTTFPDYVFEKDYNLIPLDRLKTEILKNKRLNGFENADAYLKNGMNVSEIIVKQHEKIEELYLYIIDLNEKINKLQNSIKNTK